MPGSDTLAQPGDAGLTLIEVMISLALFGLISLAGFTFVDSELRVRARTEGRLERLGDLQRAMYVLTGDLEQMSGGDPVQAGDGLSFHRYAAGGGQMEVTYDLGGGALRRNLGGRIQTLAPDISAIRWRFYLPGKGWADSWPSADNDPALRPTAIALDMTIKGEGFGAAGVLRRLVALPARP
jgi:general secretion pathway protein J